MEQGTNNKKIVTFHERYQIEPTWHGRAIIMEIYHLAQTIRHKDWTIAKTAKFFEVSVGLVSENLRLANAIHINDKILKCESRQEALKRLNGYD